MKCLDVAFKIAVIVGVVLYAVAQIRGTRKERLMGDIERLYRAGARREMSEEESKRYFDNLMTAFIYDYITEDRMLMMTTTFLESQKKHAPCPAPNEHQKPEISPLFPDK